jgi:RNA-directed DNA polymerase
MRYLGTRPGAAIPICLSRKGPWRCARTLATQTAMSKIPPSGTNQWLKDQGLLSVKELWVYPVE